MLVEGIDRRGSTWTGENLLSATGGDRRDTPIAFAATSPSGPAAKQGAK